MLSRITFRTFLHGSLLPHQSVSMFPCFFLLLFILYVFMSISVSMCRPTGSSCVGTLASPFFFMHAYVCVVHVCCWGTSDLRARRTPRLLAGGLSTLGGRADLIFHRSTAHPWTPSLSPHGRAGKLLCEHSAEICGLPAPSPPCCSLTCWASQLKANHSYRCWQLSLTHEMPLRSSSPTLLTV